MRIAAIVAVIAATQGGAACGESSSTADADGGDLAPGAGEGGRGIADDASEGAAADGGVMTNDAAPAVSADGPGQGPCPPSPPQAGAACDADAACGSDLLCEYGAGTVPTDDLVARCQDGTWRVTDANVQLPIDAGALGAACPPSFLDGANNPSLCSGPPCAYPEGTCTCTSFDHVALDGGSASSWNCVARPLGPGCPPTLAAAQAHPPCPRNGLECDYLGGTCSCNTGGPWFCSVPDVGCPAERPRLGSSCNADEPSRCVYGGGACEYPYEDLSCSCAGVWMTTPSNAVCE